MTGQITQLAAGWGFIQPDGHDPEHGPAPRVYFNRSGLQRFTAPFLQLHVGQRVEFTAITHPHGPRAIEVRVLGSMGAQA